MRRALGLVLIAAAGAAPAAAVAAVPPPVIRTGGPSRPADPKIAVVASDRPLAGRAFTVVDRSGRVVLRGRLRPATGTPKPWRHAATADLSKVTRKGTYTVRAVGRRSRPWKVDDTSGHALVRRLLRIFAANADGNEPGSIFGPAHLKDAIAANGPATGQHIDLTGGWRDAGDNLKFASTTSFAILCLELAARLDPAESGVLRQAADIGARWLMKLHPAPDQFYVLVGDGRDHSTDFRNPAEDDADTREGVGVRYAYTSDSANVLAEVAGALALVAQRSPSVRDALVATAKEWYAAAVAAGRITKIDSPFIEDFYPDDFASDDLAFAATELYRATGEDQYAVQAGAALQRGGDDQFYSGTNTGTVGPLIAAEMCGALGAPALPDQTARQVACDGLQKAAQVTHDRMARSAFATPGDVTFGWVQDNNGGGIAGLLAAKQGLDPTGRRTAAAARDYLLGRNPWGRSFIVGPGANEAKNPHHAAYRVGAPSKLLDGAVVGGLAPAKQISDYGLKLAPGGLARFNSAYAAYEDRREDFVTSEVGLAYSATAVLLAAALQSG